ncbi:unnamed protein product (macronuclear) [Paramecium tetraurelia]|uniref:RING-type domain-containing protein n=1 Tax=Paramecium tetraurelia TaxID=5888 RepID=A0DPD3_PARTE|nr:uncharacterized protein GSPATT00019082001 [Paramecium tetraurelia]CAK84900.1 unnamed protein product [Paramecium tetraurelia]|eukprot:XP_001452297.1 hypothetical protein (macronuclear) [Paramecium tetraurelia strain d4-2]
MDPKLNFQETLQCQYCKVYVNKACQQVHYANCQFNKNQHQQGITNNNDNKSFTAFNNQNQPKDIFGPFQQITFKNVPQKTHQLNNTDIQNTQKTPPPIQFIKKPIQNIQFQDTQIKGNQQYQQSFIQLNSNTETQQQDNRFVSKKEFPFYNKEISQEPFPLPKPFQTPSIPQQNTSSEQILLHQQQKNSNGNQPKPELGFNQFLIFQQSQVKSFGDIQNQQQNQEQSLIFKTQNINNDVNINQQQQFPAPKKFENNQQKQFKINFSHLNPNMIQNKNLQQIQPQQNQQQQQQSIYNSQTNLSSSRFNQLQNNRQPDNHQPTSQSQPIQGQPSIPRQFIIPQMPQNIQPPPLISSFFTRFKYSPQNNEDDDDDDDDNDEYDTYNSHDRGLPNFDINRQYTDDEVNRMNQEQIYQYFSNLHININHGYSEDLINEKIYQNFPIRVDDNRIDICVICQESFTQETFTTDKQLPCSHLFHEICLIGWLKRSKQCPICKTEIEL